MAFSKQTTLERLAAVLRADAAVAAWAAQVQVADPKRTALRLSMPAVALTADVALDADGLDLCHDRYTLTVTAYVLTTHMTATGWDAAKIATERAADVVAALHNKDSADLGLSTLEGYMRHTAGPETIPQPIDPETGTPLPIYTASATFSAHFVEVRT